MLETIRASRVTIVFVVCVSIFTDTFMYGLIIPVLPYALVSRVKIDPSQLQFWNTTFMASWAGSVLIGSVLFGWLAGVGISKKWSFVAGQAILAASTVLFMLAKHLPLLVVARVLQGLSGGAINTLGYTLTFDAVGQDHIGVAIGYVTMALSLGVFFGPVIGGPLYDYAGYHWVFIPMIVLIILEMIMRIFLIEPAKLDEQSNRGERQRLLNEDSTGGGHHDSDYTNPNLRPRRSSMGDPTEIFRQPKGPEGSPLLVLLGNRRFVIAMLGLFVGNNFVGAIESTLPVFAFDELNFSSTQVGLLLLAATWPQFLGPLAGWIVDRAGPKWPTVFGFIFGGVALLLMRFTEHDSKARLAILIVLLTIYGCSITLFWGPIIAEVTFAVEDLEKKRPGVFGEHGALSLAFGLQNAAFGAGAMLGPIYAGAILIKFGWGTMTLVLGVISLLTAIPITLYTGGNIFEKEDKAQPAISTSDSA